MEVVEKGLQKLEDEKFIVRPKKQARVNPGQKKQPEMEADSADKIYNK